MILFFDSDNIAGKSPALLVGETYNSGPVRQAGTAHITVVTIGLPARPLDLCPAALPLRLASLAVLAGMTPQGTPRASGSLVFGNGIDLGTIEFRDVELRPGPAPVEV